MRKRSVVIISILMLMSSCAIFPVNSEINEKNTFELDVYGGGFSPTTRLFRIQIDVDGELTYSIIYPEDRITEEWTVISQYDLSESEKIQIWNAIESNDFFNLNNLYKNSNIRGGTYAEMTIIGGGEDNTVRTENIPLVQFDNIIKTINSVTPGDEDLFYNAIFNYRPYQPSIPSGPPNGKPKREYTYTSTTSDYNSDQIYYLFNWGDESDSGWKGPYNSSETGSATKIWNNQGSYNITVKAKDDPNSDGDLSDGKESIWSDPFLVSMPKSKISKLQFIGLLEKIIQEFPMLNILQKFYNLFLVISNEISLIDESGIKFYVSSLTEQSGTRVSIRDCKITVNIYMQIRGPGATVNLTKDIEKNIEDVWNNDWKIKCKDDCDPREPGCNVTFDAHVVRMPAGEYLPGFHDITIVNDTSANGEGHISSVDVWESDPDPPPPPPNRVLDGPRPNDQTHPTTTGEWDANEPADTYAHEAGHLMGLDDTYPPYQNNFGDHIMNNNGAVRQEDIDLIIGMSGVECPCECCPEEDDDQEPENDITVPQNNSDVSSPLNVTGTADDGYGGSGVALLDYMLEWDGGSYDGGEYEIDPPITYVSYVLGPINLDYYIDPGDWIIITTYATDAAGNTGQDSVTVTLAEEGEDTTPPITEKTIGQPQWEDGYVVTPFTPIWLDATDPEPGSGVDYIHYEVWWDSDGNEIVDILMGSENIPGDSVEITFGLYEVYYNIVELRWYAVDNAENVELTHYQEHYVVEYT